MHTKNKRGQSTVEYILLVTAVLAVIIAFLVGKGNVFQNQMNQTLNTATSDAVNLGQVLSDSHQAQSPSTGNSTPPYTINPIPGANATN